MLRIHQSENAGAAKSYYSAALQHGDYYTKDGEGYGLWGGRLAKAMGLTGDIDGEHFARLCDNKHPITNKPLTPRTKNDRTPGYDINFHPPKSLTIMHAIGGDKQLEVLFQDAVLKTMLRLEQDAATRVRTNNKSKDRKTGNLLWSTFIHQTSRPIDGIPDPHLHAHAFTFNVTYDTHEKRLKAAKFYDIKSRAPYFEKFFHAELAKSVLQAGYAVRQTDSVAGWEIAGIDQGMIDKFSRRTQQIEAVAAEKGVTNPEQKSALGARTRASKTTDLSMDALRDRWRDRLSKDERDAIVKVYDAKVDTASRPIDQDARLQRTLAAADYALKHHFERESVVHLHDLARTAAKQCLGHASVPEIERALKQKLVLDPDGFATHMGVWREETEINAHVLQGRGQCMPIRFDAKDVHVDGLSDAQNKAIQHVLGSKDHITGIVGRAGVGKTTVMKHAVSAIDAAGYDVTVLTPTNAAKDDLHLDGFEQTQTLASYLKRKQPSGDRKELIWLDEAGLVGNEDMLALIRHAKASGARVLLTGDPNQHGAVARGRPLKMMTKYHRESFATVRDIRRQKSPRLRDIVQDLSEHHTTKGLRQMHKNGQIVEIHDEDARHTQIADTYQKLRYAGRSKKNPAKVQLISPTLKDGKALTKKVRERLRQDGELKGPDKIAQRLVSRSLSDVQRQDASAYRYGDILEFHQNAKGGHRRGDRLVVSEIHDNGQVMVKDMRRGVTIPLPHQTATQFDVYQAEALPLTQGDKIVARRNGQSTQGKRLESGRTYTVRGVTDDGRITLSNGWQVDPNQYGHFDHGYVLTSIKSQGKNEDHVLISASKEAGRAVNPEQAYVSVSRARQSAMIFTDDANYHIRRAATAAKRQHAVDVVRAHQRQQQLNHALRLGPMSPSERVLRGMPHETPTPSALPDLSQGTKGPSHHPPVGKKYKGMTYGL